MRDGKWEYTIRAYRPVNQGTVKNHLFHIFDKLGISNRVELVLYAASRQ